MDRALPSAARERAGDPRLLPPQSPAQHRGRLRPLRGFRRRRRQLDGPAPARPGGARGGRLLFLAGAARIAAPAHGSFPGALGRGRQPPRPPLPGRGHRLPRVLPGSYRWPDFNIADSAISIGPGCSSSTRCARAALRTGSPCALGLTRSRPERRRPATTDRLLAARLGIPRNQVQQWIGGGGSPSTPNPSASLVVRRDADRLDPPPPPPGSIRRQPSSTLLHADDDLVALDKPAGWRSIGAGRATRTSSTGSWRASRDHRRRVRPSRHRPSPRSRHQRGDRGRPYRGRLSGARAGVRRTDGREVVPRARPWCSRGGPDRDRAADRTPSGRAEEDGHRRAWTAGPHGDPSDRHRGIALAAGGTDQDRANPPDTGPPAPPAAADRGRSGHGEARWRALPGGPARRALAAFSRPALHAWRLRYAHPRDGRLLTVEAAPAADLRALWETATATPWPALPEC